MNIRNLIEELEYAAETIGDDAEIRFASQPAWPFEYSVSSTVVMSKDTMERNMRSELEEEGLPEEEINEAIANEFDNGDVPSVVYLVEGGQIGYLPGEVKNEIGW